MSAYSPIDSLRQLSPVSDAEAAAAFGVAGREELLAGIARARSGRRLRRRGLVVAVAALSAAVIATAGTWAVLRAPARETTSVQCLIGNSDAIIPSTSGDPAYDCALGWQQEYGTTPPPLIAYDNALGGVTVIPRDQKPRAGWTRLPGQSQDVALIELQESLDDYIAGLESGCFDAATATTVADARLAQFGFTGWAVNVRTPEQGANPGGCYSGEAIDPATKTVTLIPFGSPGGGAIFQQLAEKLRPLAQACPTVASAAAAVRAAGSSLGLSPAPPETSETYNLEEIPDDSLRCALVYENVGGAIALIVRGPSG